MERRRDKWESDGVVGVDKRSQTGGGGRVGDEGDVGEWIERRVARGAGIVCPDAT